MYYDDRLGTVLRQRAGGKAVARIQYRQLLDLLGTMRSDARGAQVDAAYARLAEVGEDIPAETRAAMLGEPGMRLRNPRLIVELCDDEPRVASAAILHASLDAEEWLDIVPALPPHARAALRRRPDLQSEVKGRLARLGIFDRGLPPPQVTPQTELSTPAKSSEAEACPPSSPEEKAEREQDAIAAQASEGIGALVRRIEHFRKARQIIDGRAGNGDPVRGDSPRLPLGEDAAPARLPPAAFDFGTDVEGRIVWADPRVAPMTVGLRIAARDGGSPAEASAALVIAFRRRQPIHAERLEIIGAPAISGSWRVDAVPVFDPAGGRFTGYSGRMRRLATAAGAPAVTDADAGASQADRMRQLLHELRTPVNAIQGFAEVIQQQLFGPTPHEYRALAASIAGDAAHMLAGFEELERLAKLEGDTLVPEAGEGDLGKIVAATVAQLDAFTTARGGGFALRTEDDSLTIALAPAEIARLAWRLLATLAAAAAPGEVLRLRLRRRGDAARLSVQLPGALAEREGEALFQAGASSAAPQALMAGMFGAGFTLRLVRAEARAAGGSLERRGERLRLILPLLTPAIADHSHDAACGAA